MKIRELTIENFRGIKRLNWAIPADKKLICLIGKGDSGKSTILDAIDWLLGPRWNLPIDTCDFNDENKPILLKAVLTDMPASLIGFDALGMYQRGIRADGSLDAEPLDENEPCVLVGLRINTDLEPEWFVFDGDGEERPFSTGMRRKLGVAQLGMRADADLRWTRSSALGRISRDVDGARLTLAEATSAARKAVREFELDANFSIVLSDIKDEAQGLGAAEFEELRPGVDLAASSAYGAIALYSGSIPVSKFGLGTRRLTSLAVQKLAATDKSTLLIDELENGLEPHRAIGVVEAFAMDPGVSQALMTTHSSSVVEYCPAKSLALVQNTNGAASVRFIPDDLEGLHRSSPSSFLAREVVVVEGKTEEGAMKALFRYWNDTLRHAAAQPTTAARGIVVCQGGGGASACGKSISFAKLGYQVKLLADADDRSIDDKVSEAKAAGVTISRWPDGWKIESAIFNALNRTQIAEFMSFLVADEIVSDLKIRAGLIHVGLPPTVEEAIASEVSDEILRARLTDASAYRDEAGKERSWFKSVRTGELVGEWLFNRLGEKPEFKQTEFYGKLTGLLDAVGKTSSDGEK